MAERGFDALGRTGGYRWGQKVLGNPLRYSGAEADAGPLRGPDDRQEVSIVTPSGSAQEKPRRGGRQGSGLDRVGGEDGAVEDDAVAGLIGAG